MTKCTLCEKDQNDVTLKWFGHHRVCSNCFETLSNNPNVTKECENCHKTFNFDEFVGLCCKDCIKNLTKQFLKMGKFPQGSE